MPDQQSLLPFIDHEASHRDLLIARWLGLVRTTLPDMAVQCGWPITQDHCFMRVCLDTALGAPWHTVVKRPAIRHLSAGQLLAAIEIADDLVRCPAKLGALNLQSIRWRQDLLRPGTGS